MKNKLSIVSVILVAFVLIPQIAFASWWNPFTWFKKNTKPIEQPTVQVLQTNVPVVVDKKIPIQPANNVEKKTKKKVSTPIVSPVVNTPTIPATPSSDGGSGGGYGFGSSGAQLAVPLKCSDYERYFASISSCEFIKQNSSGNKDGVEIEHPLYTLCKQCLLTRSNE